MTNVFTASNGVVVERTGGKAQELRLSGGGAVRRVQLWECEKEALREFFLHERDQELGRWRSARRPDYVVYPRPEGNNVTVLSEASGVTLKVVRDEATSPSFLYSAAREYFEAHPEPKPWHDAKPGEVWLLTINGHESAFYPSKSLDRVFTPVAPSTGMTAVAMNGSTISSGRRIWPEN